MVVSSLKAQKGEKIYWEFQHTAKQDSRLFFFPIQGAILEINKKLAISVTCQKRYASISCSLYWHG